MGKKFVVSLAALTACFAVLLSNVPVSAANVSAQTAAQSQVIGHAALPDQGPGGHAGWPLYRDGTGGSGGFVNLFPGGMHTRGKVASVSWKFSPDSTPSDPKIDLTIVVSPLSLDSDPMGIFTHPFVFKELRADGQPYEFVTNGFTVHASVSVEHYF